MVAFFYYLLLLDQLNIDHLDFLNLILVLFDELWHEEKPGLSSYADQPELAAQSVRKLIQLAKGKHI